MIKIFTPSRKLLDFISEFEGDYHYAYNDPVGHCTAGRGRLLHRGNCVSSDFARYGTKNNPKLTADQTAEMLKQDIKPYAAAVARLAKPGLAKLPRNKRKWWREAMTTLAYNIGYGNGGLGDSTLLRLFNAGNYTAAAQQFGRWVYADGRKLPGLVRRRMEEEQMATRGDYDVA